MQLLFDSFLKRLPHEVRDRVLSAVAHQTDLNPNDRLHNGVYLVLKETLTEINELEKMQEMKIDTSSKGLFASTKDRRKINATRKLIEDKLLVTKEIAMQLASLSCYLIPSMKATDEFIALLKKVDHPYIKLLIAWFEEDPSNYQETREKIDVITIELSKHPSFNEEMNAFVHAIKSWIYGVIGDVAVLKSVYKHIHDRLTKSNNIIEIRGLQDASTNVIWWLLHSGVEANIKEMFDFVEPSVLKYKLYMSYTDILNLKGAMYSYFGDNAKAIEAFEELIAAHEKYNDNYRLSIAIGNCSESYFIEGKILQAKKMMEQAIKLYKESTGKWPYLYLTEMGNMYYLTGDDRAEASFLQAYEIQKKEKTIFKAFIMFELIHYYLRVEEMPKAQAYLSELKSLAKELEILSVNAQVDYLLGYSEMLNLNFSNAIKFIQTSLDLAQQTKDFDLILSCNIQLAAINLQKYRLSEQPDMLNSVLNYIDTTIQLAIENQHMQILSLGLVIRALIRASKSEFDSAFQDLNKVKEITKDIDYEKWKNDFFQFEDKIIQAEKEGKMVLDRESIFNFILPQFKSMLSFKLAERKPKESEVLGLFVITESGVPIYTKLGKSLKADKLIMSGLLTAITHLSESVVEGKDKGRLQEVLYEEFWIIVQPIKNGFVAVIATEAAAEVRLWAHSIATRVKEVPVVVSELTDKLEEKIGDIIDQMSIK